LGKKKKEREMRERNGESNAWVGGWWVEIFTMSGFSFLWWRR
jgi:hypothetical protein